MDDKKIIEILINLLKKDTLDEKEKEAIHSAIGILSWTALAQSRLKGMKEKKDKKREMSVADEAFPRERKIRKNKSS